MATPPASAPPASAASADVIMGNVVSGPLAGHSIMMGHCDKATAEGDWLITWEYQDRRKGFGWFPFHETLSAFVENAFSRGDEECRRQLVENEFVPGHHCYRWDLKAFKQYRERDGEVVATKKIRRIMKFEPRAAASTS